MNVLIPTADYPPIEGGIATVTLQVSRQLAAMGHNVTVVAPRFPGQGEFDEAEPVTVVRYRGYDLGWLRFFPMLAATWPHVKHTDLILAINIAYGGVIGWLASRVCHKPYVAFAYAYEFLKFRDTPLLPRLLRAAYARARVVVAISNFTRDNLVAFGVQPSQIATIFPGAPQVRPLSEEALSEIKHKYVLDSGRVILAVGRFVPRKGHLDLVRAMPRILERFPETKLVLVGQGPSMSDAVREAHDLGVLEQVLFPGRLSDEDVAGLYQACDVFALPTGVGEGGQVEGFGLVFVEAHAHGKPVVAGRSGGVVDAVIDGETGLIVEPGQPEAVADAVISLLADPELARRLGENGKRRVESELNWRRFTERMLEAAGADR